MFEQRKQHISQLLAEVNAEAGKQSLASDRLLKLGEQHLGTPGGLAGSFVAGAVVGWVGPKVSKHVSLAGTIASVRSLSGLLGTAQWSDLFIGPASDHGE